MLEAQDGVRPEPGARLCHRRVGLADVGAVGLGGARHVEAVVDDQRHALRGEDGPEAAGLGDELRGRQVVVAELDGRDAAADGLLNHGLDAARAGEAAVGDEVEVEREGAAAHQLTLARSARVAGSSPPSRSRSATWNEPGPSARSAASSAATP